MTDTLTTPLHQLHADLGATFIDFAGWSMPIRYRSIREEHEQVRSSGGLFDVSHMGRLRVTGDHAEPFVDRLCSRQIAGMPEQRCRYGFFLNDRGGVKDDVLVYRQGERDFLIVVNASNRVKIVEHAETVRAAAGFTATIDDQTSSTAMVAIQGPKVMDLVKTISSEAGELKRFAFLVKSLMVTKLTVSRTGYTGEDGVEVIIPSGSVGLVMKLLMKETPLGDTDSTIQAAGLGARDTLRLEAAMPLYGNELTEDIDALASGLGFAITLDREPAMAAADGSNEAFIGQHALQTIRDEGGPARRLIGLRLEGKRTARTGMDVARGGSTIGRVTSGCLSPTLGESIAMAYVDADHAEDGNAFEIVMGERRVAATSCPLPFYKRPSASVASPT